MHRVNLITIVCGLACCLSCNSNGVSTKEKINAVNERSEDSNKTVRKKDSVTNNSSLTINADTAGFRLRPHHISLKKGLEFDLNIPEGYNISVAAEGFRRLRFLNKSPDGRLFATDMFDKTDNKKGRIYLFGDWNDSVHQFNKSYTFLAGLHNPNQIAFYSNRDSSFIYVAETEQLSYYVYHDGDTVAVPGPTVIARFPDYGLGYKYGGWHLTRSIAFHHNKIYVSVGSSCNACIEKEEVRATILEMNPDGTGIKTFASGLRNSVGIKWVGERLWATSMGRDLIGPDKPEDLLLQVQNGIVYHWPFYYQYKNKIYPDGQMQDSANVHNMAIPPPPPVAFTGFKAHSAPLGLEYFKNFADPRLTNAIVVALHGSTSVWRQRGNAIVKANGSNNYTDVVNGFLKGKSEAGRWGRPCDVLMNDSNSFFFTDDHNGVLYYVWKEH
jgi:glucose/arabinose dehydrogenase